MLTIKISSVVDSIVKQMLARTPDFVEDDRALYFGFHLKLTHHSASSACGLHLLYHRTPGSTYVSVFSAVTPVFEKLEKIESNRWKHEATHDSCWRDIQAFSKIYFEMAADVNAQLGEAYQVAPVDMSQHNSFDDMFTDVAFKWVKVKVKKDPTDTNNYRRLIELLKD